MKSLLFIFLGLLILTSAIVQHPGLSVPDFLDLSSMDLFHSGVWLQQHHFRLIKNEKNKGIQRQTYLFDQPDVKGNHDVLFLAFDRIGNPPQYLSYSTNPTRFNQFRRALPTYQFHAVEAYQDTQGNAIRQYQNERNVIELTALWSNRLQDTLYSISLSPGR